MAKNLSSKSNKRAKGEGSIRQRSDGRWEGRLTIGFDPGNGKQIRRSFYGATQAEVRKKMQAAAVEVNDGIYTEPSKLTVAAWLAVWEKEYLGDVKPFTVASYHTQIENHIKPALGAVALQSITAPQIQSFYNQLLKTGMKKPKHDAAGKIVKNASGETEYDLLPLSAKSIKNVHGVLHKALQQAVDIGYIRFNPADACKLPRIIKKEIKPLDETESSAFLSAIRGHRFETLFTVTLFTGLREGEVIGLTWDCVNFDNDTIRIEKQLRRQKGQGGVYEFAPLKNDKVRTITAAPFVMKMLAEHHAAQLERFRSKKLLACSNLVFTDELGGHLATHTVFKDYKKVVAGIGRPDARFHDLRHSYAVAAIRAGDDIKTVQSNLGHATSSFTLDTYGHCTDQMKQASADRMESYINGLLPNRKTG